MKKIDSDLPDTDIPKELADKSNYIEYIFSIFEKISKLISDAFENNNTIVSALKEVFSDIQNSFHKYNCSYILPFSIDTILKKYSLEENKSESFYKFIDRLILFFPSIPEKDAFIDIHRNLVI